MNRAILAGVGSLGAGVVQGLVDFLKSLGAARIAAMAAVTVALIGFFAFLIVRVTAPQMTPLFTDLSLEDSSAIIKDLERQAIPYELKNDGAIVLVPKDRVPRLRMKLAEGGLPKGGGVGYEIFDKSDALGATSFVQNINHLRALEGELARTIRAIDRVQAARVHLVLPERPLFSRDKAEASASIVLKVRGTLEPQQVRAIRHLVASAVNGLKPRARLGRRRDRPAAGRRRAPATTAGGVSADERKLAYERRLREQVESIVTSVVGPGRARVQLTADFDFNRVTQTSDKFDPEGRVVRSSQTREEIIGQRRRPATARSRSATSCPAASARPEGAPAAARPEPQDRGNRQLRDFAHHQDRSDRGRPRQPHLGRGAGRRHLRQERQGRARLSAARARKRSTASPRWCARAIGFDQKRGDQVEVVNLRFAETPSHPDAASRPAGCRFLQFTKDDIMRWVELGVMALLGLLVLLLGGAAAGAAHRRARRRPQRQAAAAGAVGIVGRRRMPPARRRPRQPAASPPAPNVSIVGGDRGGRISNRTSEMIDIAQVQGQVHAQSVQKVGELADKNPNETVSIIRSWLHENAA